MTAPIPAAQRRQSFLRFAGILVGWVAFWIAVSYLGHSVKPDAPDAPATSSSVTASALTTYVNDFAAALEPSTRDRLNASLQQFEKGTSNQVAVAIYAQLPDIPVEEFTIKVAELSRLGRKGLDNGAVLFVFTKNKAARIEVGYGLEGALTDAQTHRILETVFAPP